MPSFKCTTPRFHTSHPFFYLTGQSLITRPYVGTSEAGKLGQKLDDFVTNSKSYYCIKRNNRLLGGDFCNGPPLWPPKDPDAPFFTTYNIFIHLQKGQLKISSSY